jgi:putative aminopeptidase FrvX
VLEIGSNAHHKRVWMLAHLDQISYLVDPGSNGRYPLLPLCYHMQEAGSRPAHALKPDLERGGFAVCARGVIEVDGSDVYFLAEGGAQLRPGMRVVYESDFGWDRQSGQITGHLDDTVGCTAVLLAAGVLRHYPVEVLIELTDEEEGPPGDANQSFAKGGRRLVRLFDPPELAIVSDVHESEAMVRGPGPVDIRPGDGAVFAERSSSGRGTATPPHLYALEQHLAVAIGERGISLRENWGGYVSRSEDVNATIVTPNIALIGVLCSNRHFANGRPTANLGDVLDLAKIIVAFTLLAHSSVWRRVMPQSAELNLAL